MITSRKSACWRVLAACLLVAVVAILGPASAGAAVPQRLNYQGYITDGSGAPTGPYDMVFRLYADSTGGASLWSEAYIGVQVTNGIFNVILGSVSPLSPSVLDGRTLWLETQVGATTLAPRSPVIAVAYAARAGVADSAAHGPQPWSESLGNVYRSSGRVGVSTDTPASRLHARVDGTTFDTYALFQTSGGTGYAGGILLSNNTASSGTAFKMTASYNFAGNGKARFGFVSNSNTESFVSGPALEFDYASGNVILGQGGGRVGVGTASPAYPLDVSGEMQVSGAIHGKADDAILADNATNADKVDNYHAGNATGQVPISNGTRCVTLNADKTDGNHVLSVDVYTGGTTTIISTDWLVISTFGTADRLRIKNNGYSSYIRYWYTTDLGVPVQAFLYTGATLDIVLPDAGSFDLRVGTSSIAGDGKQATLIGITVNDALMGHLIYTE